MPPFNRLSDGRYRQDAMAQLLDSPSAHSDSTLSNPYNHLRSPYPWGNQSHDFDVTIARLAQAIRDVHAYIDPLILDFQRDIANIRLYARSSLIDALWESRWNVQPRPLGWRLQPGRTNSDISDLKNMLDTTKRAKQAWVKMERALTAAAYGTRPTIGGVRRRFEEFERRGDVQRAAVRLRAGSGRCLELLGKAKKSFEGVEGLRRELRCLEQTVREWGQFADGRHSLGGRDDSLDSFDF